MKTLFVSILLFLLLIVPGAKSVRASRTLSMNDPAILYSPYNWAVTPSHAKTINAGAYLKVIFSGTSCRLITDTSGDAAPYSEFWARIDGGPFQKYTLAAGNPTFTVADGLTDRSHLLEVVIKSTSETIDRWNNQSTAVVITGIVLDTGSSVRLPVRKPYNILIYGDSITEGVRTAGYAGIPNDTDRNDATQDYSWLLSQSLAAEIGVVGFGATGLTRGGSGAVPALPQSYNFLWASQPRSFLPAPDLVLYNEGTNDRSSITTDFLTVIRGIQAAAPNCKQMLLLPFNGSRADEIKAAVAKAANRNVVYGDTTGFWNSADASDGLHPYDYAHIGFIAPKVAALAAPLLVTPKKL